jgi:hypothetical protein
LGRLTLARRIVPISWILASVLERLTIFNSHYLVAIRPKTEDGGRKTDD